MGFPDNLVSCRVAGIVVDALGITTEILENNFKEGALSHLSRGTRLGKERSPGRLYKKGVG